MRTPALPGSGLKAKLVVFGMIWGYKAQLDALEKHLAI